MSIVSNDYRAAITAADHIFKQAIRVAHKSHDIARDEAIKRACEAYKTKQKD